MDDFTSNMYVVVAILVVTLYGCLIASLVVLRTRRHEELLQKNAMLRALPDMMFLLSCDGVYLASPARDPTDLSVPPSSFPGSNLREILPPDLASRFEEAFAQASDEPVLVEYGLPIKGEVRHLGTAGAMRI